MQKVIFGFLVLSLMFATSCKKSNSSPHGTWSFKGSSASPSSSVNGNTVIAGVNVGTPGGGVEAVSGSNDLNITFTPAVTASNSDITVASGAVTVSLSLGTSTIYSSQNSGAVSETYSSGGNTNVSTVGTGIMLYNSSNPSDSALITFTGIN